jgi:hypothetical protein
MLLEMSQQFPNNQLICKHKPATYEKKITGPGRQNLSDVSAVIEQERNEVNKARKSYKNNRGSSHKRF